jgi:hypothetical protein
VPSGAITTVGSPNTTRNPGGQFKSSLPSVASSQTRRGSLGSAARTPSCRARRQTNSTPGGAEVTACTGIGSPVTPGDIVGDAESHDASSSVVAISVASNPPMRPLRTTPLMGLRTARPRSCSQSFRRACKRTHCQRPPRTSPSRWPGCRDTPSRHWCQGRSQSWPRTG